MQKSYRDQMLIMAGSFFYMMCPMMTTPLIAGFAESLGASGAVMGITAGLMNFTSLVIRPFSGGITDKSSKYTASLFGATAMAVASLGYAFTDSKLLLMLFRIINGIGFSICSVAMSTWFASMLPTEKTGSGMGIYGTMNALSMAVAPVIGIWMNEKFGYRGTFCTAAFMSILIVVLIYFVEDKGEPEIVIKNEKVKSTEKKKHFIAIERKLIPLSLIVMFFTIPYFATQSFLVTYIYEKEINANPSIFFPMYAVVLLAMRIVFRKYFDRKSFYFFVGICSVSALLGILSLSIMKSNFGLGAAAIFMAGGYGIMCSVAQATAIRQADTGKKGAANSTYYIGLDLGMAMGPVVGGILYENLNIVIFYPVLMINVAAGVFVMIIWKISKEKQHLG